MHSLRLFHFKVVKTFRHQAKKKVYEGPKFLMQQSDVLAAQLQFKNYTTGGYHMIHDQCLTWTNYG
jgi:hypothetical protein